MENNIFLLHPSPYARIRLRLREEEGERRGGQNFLPLTRACPLMRGDKREERRSTPLLMMEISIAGEREREKRRNRGKERDHKREEDRSHERERERSEREREREREEEQ